MQDSRQTKVLIFIVAYNAEKHIEGVLERIPETFWSDGQFETEILIIDDASKDATVERCHDYAKKHNRYIRVLCNPRNQGYGGNQKVGYTYAIENGFDVVVLLHGDGQYPPEQLGQMVEPIAKGAADAVFGSRMMVKKDALKGGMPRYKFIGNIVLTKLQNFLLGTKLAEFHTGYRTYRVKTLQKIPFSYNSGDFDFDTDIIIQLVDTGARITEIPIPTHYGDEICNVNGMKYALQVLRNTLLSRVQRLGIYYTRKFDYDFGKPHYDDKSQFDSTHKLAIDMVKPGSVVLDIGCGYGHIGKVLKEEKQCILYGIDEHIGRAALEHYAGVAQASLDSEQWRLPANIECIDYVLMLDVLEHLQSPEQFLARLRQLLAPYNATAMITTANVAFCMTRLSLVLGQFNYGKRGILDMTHKRLFTFRSFRHLLDEEGFTVTAVQGIPTPIPFIVRNRWLAGLLMRINRALIHVSKGLFSYQIAMIAQPMPTLDTLLKDAHSAGQRKLRSTLKKNAGDTPSL